MANLRAALDALAGTGRVRVVKVSSAYETAPVGFPDQPAFVNLAVEIETALTPLELLNAVKEIERRLGRTPTARWGPREIDIDLVLWGSRVMDTAFLVLPHKEFRTRAFVLEPLAEIAPDAVDPVTGFTVQALRDRPGAQGGVTKLGPFA
jgi:2-amino-4-hydroxy-6-hydroxymethyldihydropteridine diphosphokinase